MAKQKQAIVRTTQLVLLGYGLLVGALFPLFFNFILIHQPPVFFWLSCLGAGAIVGVLSFVVVKVQLLSRLQNINSQIRLMQLRHQFEPIIYNFSDSDVFGQLFKNLNELLDLGQEQYSEAYQSAVQLIGDRFKFNRRIRQFNNRLQTLSSVLQKMDEQVQQQQTQSQEQLQIFLEMNRSIQDLGTMLVHLLNHSSSLELQLKKQEDYLHTITLESKEIEAVAAGSDQRHQEKAILELSLDFASESSRSLNNQEQRLEQIAGLLQEIEDIAESTHLLSINASIEAARAGETGRGFTIVALQIRNLATKSSSLTSAIREQIESITELARSSTYALDDLRDLMGNKSVELRDSFKRISYSNEQAQKLQSELQPLFKTLRSGLEELSEKMVALNQIRDSGRQGLDNQQAVYLEIREQMQASHSSFLTLKDIGEKGLFNEEILQQLTENIRTFEKVSQNWQKNAAGSRSDVQLC